MSLWIIAILLGPVFLMATAGQGLDMKHIHSYIPTVCIPERVYVRMYVRMYASTADPHFPASQLYPNDGVDGCRGDRTSVCLLEEREPDHLV